MKSLVATQVGCAKELKATKNGGRFSVVAEFGKEEAKEQVWITCFVQGEALNKANALVAKNEGRMPPGVNVAGEISGIGLYEGKPNITLNCFDVEASYGFGNSTLAITATNVGVGKDLWKSQKANFSRTSGALEFWDAKFQKAIPTWVDLKFFGALATLADKIQIGKGSFVNISGEISEIKVASDKGQKYLNISIDVGSLKRIHKHSKGYDERASEDGYEMPRNYMDDFSSEEKYYAPPSPQNPQQGQGQYQAPAQASQRALAPPLPADIPVDKPNAGPQMEQAPVYNTDDIDDFLAQFGVKF